MSAELQDRTRFLRQKGTFIEFSDKADFSANLIDGWYVPEDTGVWTNGTESIIQIKLPSASGRFRLSLAVSPYLEQKVLPKQRLGISVQNERIYEAEIGFDQCVECEISETATFGRDHINVILRHPDATSPFELNKSEDRRVLAFKVKYCELLSIDDIYSLVLDDPALIAIPIEVDTSKDSILLDDNPRQFSGEAFLKFHYNPYISLFGSSNRHESIQILNAILPPAQIPIRINQNNAQTIRNRRMVLRDHITYPSPIPIAAYSIYGGRLWGDGIVTYGNKFVLLWDCVPRYLRNLLTDDGHKFPIPVLVPENWANRSIIQSDLPIACPIHPNLIYGHFLLEMLPRFFVLSLLNEAGAKFLVAFPDDLPNWVESFVKLYFDEQMIIRYNKNRQCIDAPSVIVASMMHNDHNFHPAFNLMIADIHRRAQASAKNTEASSHKSKVYLSRSRFSRNQRLKNQLEVEALMSGLGFEIVHPQELTVCEQLAMFKGADFVAGEYSSAIHGSMFCDLGTRVLCIDYHSSYQSSIARIRQQPHCFVTPDDGDFRHWRLVDDKERSYNVDLPTLLQMTLSMFTNDETSAYENSRRPS